MSVKSLKQIMAETGLPPGYASRVRGGLLADDAEKRLQRLRVRVAQNAPSWKIGEDGFADPKDFAQKLIAECFSIRPPTEFEKRSALIRAGIERKKNPPHDAHVQVWYAFTETERAIWTCGACGVCLRHMDRPRNKDGKPKRHCGCRTGKTRRGDLIGKAERQKRTAAQKRAKRLAQMDKKWRDKLLYHFRLHDAHVIQWARQKPPLHDAHVRALRANDAAYARWKTATDAAYRLNQRMRVQIRKALHGKKAGRSWESFLGYTLEDLSKHLERMLPKGHTLMDCLKAGWHIDHITPKSLFDCSQPDQLKAAWCLSNLRLIPAIDNLRKNARVEVLL